MTLYSINQGCKGAMSIFKDNEYIKTLHYSSIDEWYNEIYYSEDVIIIVEKVHSMPKQGVVSTFNFGRKLGEIEAMCKILGNDPTYIEPRKWKQHFNLIKELKNKVCEVAKELEPDLLCFGSR